LILSAAIRGGTMSMAMARPVEYRHGPARPGHLLTQLNELIDGPVEPGHDGKWAISAADGAMLANMRSKGAITGRRGAGHYGTA
jgi:hypothetical protein